MKIIVLAGVGKAKTAQGEKKIMPLISVIMGVHNSETDKIGRAHV